MSLPRKFFSEKSTTSESKSADPTDPNNKASAILEQKLQELKPRFYVFPANGLSGKDKPSTQEIAKALNEAFNGKKLGTKTINGLFQYPISAEDLTSEPELKGNNEFRNVHVAFIEFDIQSKALKDGKIQFSMKDIISLRDRSGKVLVDDDEIKIDGAYLIDIQDGIEIIPTTLRK